jgi:hypothetical protein
MVKIPETFTVRPGANVISSAHFFFARRRKFFFFFQLLSRMRLLILQLCVI